MFKTNNLNFKSALATLVSSCALLYSCQVEEVQPDLQSDAEIIAVENASAKGVSSSNCKPGKNNSNRENDIKNPVNEGKVDDRTCFYDYYETKHNGVVYGNYNIKANSNQFGSRLQPRIERSFPRSNSKPGSYVSFKGTVRILEVGNTSNNDLDGTYIAQAKGKHTGGDGSPDPAICLFLAKPVYGLDKNGRRTQTSFDIFREQINKRGGEGKKGRSLVKLTNIKKGVPTNFELKVGFRKVNGKKVHYTNAKIGKKKFNWHIPQPNRGTQSGIRYGAYRVKGGKARIQWAKTSFVSVNK